MKEIKLTQSKLLKLLTQDCCVTYTTVLWFLFTYIYRSSQTAPLAAHRMGNQIQTCLFNL